MRRHIRLLLSALFLVVAGATTALTQYPATEFLPSLYHGVPIAIFVALVGAFVAFGTIAVFATHKAVPLLGAAVSILPVLFSRRSEQGARSVGLIHSLRWGRFGRSSNLDIWSSARSSIH